MIFLSIYCLVLLSIGIFNFKKSNNFDSFVVADRNKGLMLVTFSLLATMIGASSTLGVASIAYKIGFPAFWWLGAGVIGLCLQGLFLTKKVSALKAYTLADVAHKVLGKEARIIISVIIAVAWIGIIAAQFVAAAKICMSMAHTDNFIIAVIILSLVIIVYTLLGGQLSILKTDFIQFIILAGAIFVTVGFLYFGKQGAISSVKVAWLNASFTSFDLTYYIIIVGGSFFVGPDMFSRVFAAKDAATARKSIFISAAVLVVISVAIVMIGMWVRTYGQMPENINPLVYIINSKLPFALGVVLNLGLLSAIISSADTCLISSSTIVEYDLLKKTNVKLGRVMVLIIGAISIGFAIFFQNIIQLLISAYSLYTSGVVIPLAVGILAYGKRRLVKRWIIAAIAGGGIFGMISTITGKKEHALIGIGVSFLCSLVAYAAGKRESPA